MRDFYLQVPIYCDIINLLGVLKGDALLFVCAGAVKQIITNFFIYLEKMC